MITSFLLKAFVAILNFIATPLLFLSDVSFDPSIGVAAATATANIKGVLDIVPYTEATLIFCLTTVGLTEAALFSYQIIMWGIKKIPTIN